VSDPWWRISEDSCGGRRRAENSGSARPGPAGKEGKLTGIKINLFIA
jgi:hypothetical protein